MSDQNRQEPPDMWAVVKRIEEARKQGWEPDHGKARARTDAAAARRHAARVAEAARRRQATVEARETQLREVIDRAVKEQVARILADPSAVAEVLRGTGSEADQSVVDRFAASATVYYSPHLPSAKPLHEMTAEEWREHTRETWASGLPHAARPMTISDWVGRYDEADGQA